MTRSAVSHRLLEPVGDGYRFRHPLIQETVYGRLLPRPESVAAMQGRQAPGCPAQGLAARRHSANAQNSFPSGSASTCQRMPPPGSRSTVACAGEIEES